MQVSNRKLLRWSTYRNYKQMKNIIRVLGGILGILFVIFGIHLIISPLFGTLLEKLNVLSFFLIGVVFIIYGIRGKICKRLD